MRVTFRKISDERHALEIERPDGRRERVECETRSYLLHDLLHFAVESEASGARPCYSQASNVSNCIE